MALKDNIKAIKEELSAQEQLLENLIAGERFFKKHKRTFMASAIVIVVLLIGYVSLNTIKSVNLKASNEAYKILLDNPNDEKALSSLKSKNKPLYRAFIFMEALKSGDNETLKTLLTENDIIADLAAYQIQESVKSDSILEDFVVLKDGYELLKEGKVDEASIKFMTISPDSSVMSIVRALEHYQPSFKEAK
ncbi:MAG: hypothetical protein LBJ88_01800 [Campylobacteraceae bacterium]|nr:hypothetical protein [Campylobacteraceae bacterium]